MKKILKTLFLLSAISLPLSSCNENPSSTSSASSNISSTSSSSSEEQLKKVTNYSLPGGAIYDGTINKDNKLTGKGKIKFSNRDTLEGEFKEDQLDGEGTYTIYESGDVFKGTGTLNESFSFSFDYGTYSYSSNKRTYTGHFKNNLFEDEKAEFNFGTGTTYEGPFVAGSNIGQIGTMYYPPSKMKGEGVWWIKGEMIALGKIKGDTIVKGFIRFGDRSTYEGDIYFDGNNGYYRCGEGVQDFHECNYTADIVGGPKDEYLYKYVGKFDYRISQWIYGNGVMYFSDVNQVPTSYIPGFFTSLKLLKDYDGNEDEIALLDGYSIDMKTTYHPQQNRVDDYVNKYGTKEAKIVFAGDSYLDMWQASYNITSYEEDMKDYDSINVGIGGTIWEEWNYMKDSLIVPYCKDQVVLHLGFNDLHMGASVEEAYSAMRKLVTDIQKVKPNIRFYILSVEPSTAFSSYLQVEKQLNKKYQEFCESDEHLTFVNTASLFMNGETPISDLANYFINDNVHLNKKGYDKWVNMIKETIGL